VRAPLKTLRLAGTPCEIAFQLGKLRAAKIGIRIDYWNRHLSKIFRGRKAQQRSLENNFLRQAHEQARPYLEEIYSMAEGAKVPFEELFRLNLTELSSYVEKCTDLIFRIKTPSGNRILIAHNEDWDPSRNDVFLLEARLPKLSYAVLAYDGYLPGLSAGLNSAGLVHSVNYLRPRDLRMGLPRIFITRHLVTATGIEDALAYIRRTRRAFGQAIHLAQDSQYLGIELTARQMVFRRPSLPTSHTNHYLASRLSGKIPKAAPSSLNRLKVARRLLKEKLGRKGAKKLSIVTARKLAKEILSDRSGHPFAIWREENPPKENSATLATIFVETESLTMEVYRNRPSQTTPLRLTLR
jgi:acyl-CoA:6-aminopenicillanic acid acyl transferase